jgi:death-on-curing protein
MTIRFLALESVLRLHQYQIEQFGGVHGVRDAHLLESALAMPAATFGGHFLHADLYEMAAAYLFHIVQNHPFLDGNKRAGAAAAATFLEMNDVTLIADPDDFADFTFSVARGEKSKAAIAEYLRANSQEI